MKKNNKKGFTLVELLVVIAILAILATVSVVGYTSFTQKAKDSNAQTELVQARDIIRADLLGDTVVTLTNNTTEATDDDMTLKYEDGKLVITATSYTATNFNAELKDAFADLKDLDGEFTYASDKITYTTTAGGSAYWTLSSDTVTAGK